MQIYPDHKIPCIYLLFSGWSGWSGYYNRKSWNADGDNDDRDRIFLRKSFESRKCLAYAVHPDHPRSSAGFRAFSVGQSMVSDTDQRRHTMTTQGHDGPPPSNSHPTGSLVASVKAVRAAIRLPRL